MSQSVNVPGVGTLQFPDGMSQPEMAAAIQKNFPQIHAPAQEPSFGSQLGRQAALQLVRNPLETLGNFAAMPVDAIQGVRNFLSEKRAPTLNDFNPFAARAPGPNKLGSELIGEGLDKAGLPRAETGLEKAISFAEQVAGGAKAPLPKLGQVAPENFVRPQQMLKNQAFAQGAKEGYVVPPSAVNPTVANRLLEGLAGKVKLNQEAGMRNQAVTDRLSVRGLGQTPDAPITQGALDTIRSDAHAAGYEPIRQVGAIATDPKYDNALTAITKEAQGAERSFPGITPQSSEVDEVVGALKQKEFDSGDGIDAIRFLREKAGDAYSAGNGSLGRAYKKAAKTVEDMIERHLQNLGEPAADILKKYRDARELIAKTFTAGKALVGDSGSFNARTYASELARRKPLSGDQRAIGSFAGTFGKYTPKPTGENFPSISPLDAYGSVIAAGTTDSVAPLMVPLTRLGMREYLLSKAGQQRALPRKQPQLGDLGALLGAFPQLSGQ